jgi:protein-disulfide isomerase
MPVTSKENHVAPQKRTAPAPSPNRIFYWILVAVALAGVALLAFSVVRARSGRGAVMEPVQLDSTSLRAIYAQAKPEKLGPDSAPVKLVIFSDYMCPYCGDWAAQVQPRLVQDFVKPGTLQIAFYDFPLGGAHRYSFLAARAARCAGAQGRFWEMHDAIFGRQSEWSYASSPPVSAFESYARALGLDTSAFDGCLESSRFADVVTADHLLGEQLGINSTPTVIINEQRLQDPGLNHYEALSRTIRQAAGQGAQ